MAHQKPEWRMLIPNEVMIQVLMVGMAMGIIHLAIGPWVNSYSPIAVYGMMQRLTIFAMFTSVVGVFCIALINVVYGPVEVDNHD